MAFIDVGQTRCIPVKLVDKWWRTFWWQLHDQPRVWGVSGV